MDNYGSSNSEEAARGIKEIENSVAENFIGRELMENLQGNQQEKQDNDIREFEAVTDKQPSLHESTMKVLARNQEEDMNTKLVIDEVEVNDKSGATHNLGNMRNQGGPNNHQSRNQGYPNQSNQSQNYQNNQNQINQSHISLSNY